MLKDFKEFAVKGNAVDLAIGVVIGAAFGKIIDSLVNDIIMPPFGLIAGKVDFANLFWNLGGSHINYGLFINTIINFLIIAFFIFLLVRQINKFRTKPSKETNTKQCPFCKSGIDLQATRCPHCTSQL